MEIDRDFINKFWDAVGIAREQCKNPYVQSYLQAINRIGMVLGSDLCFMRPEGIKGALLYVLHNMRGWRGQVARETKKVFREMIKRVDRKEL